MPIKKVTMLFLGLILVSIVMPPVSAFSNTSGGDATRVSYPSNKVCAVSVTLKSANLCIRDLKKGQPFTFAPGTQATRICVHSGRMVNLIQQVESRTTLLSMGIILRGCHEVKVTSVVSLSAAPASPLSGIEVGYLGGWKSYQIEHRGIIREVPCQGRSDFFTIYKDGGQKICLADHGLVRLNLPPFTKVCGGRNTGDVVGSNFSIHLKGWGDCAFMPVSVKGSAAVYIRPLHFGAGSLY